MEPHTQEELHAFHKWYSGVHGYLSLLVCLFGIPMNLINITVLTRPHMRTPINCILTWLAVFDLCTMASYLPFALHFYCIHSPWELSVAKNSKSWMQFMIFHINFSATTHTVSIWLGVTMAIFRYKHLFSPAKGHLTRMRRLVRARLSVLIVTLLAVVGLVPNYLTNRLYPIEVGRNLTVWVMDDHLATSFTQPIVLVNLWLYSILAKLFPCVLMVIYGSLLLTTLQASLRHKLKQRSANPSSSASSSTTTATSSSSSSSSSGRRHDTDTSRTTRMLLVVIVLFVVTELPQAILIVLSVNMKDFFWQVYMPLGDLMDMLALINNGVNFVLYCSMSRDFRNTVVSLIRTGRNPVKYRGVHRGYLLSSVGTGPMMGGSSGARSPGGGNNFHLSINGLSAFQYSSQSEISHQSALMVKMSRGSSVETICVKA
ncbi:G-protein coupled receptor dmsr-1-like [Babylonia areolata]|uniref:G-protein coupled receptor dmsr-1-like n=1 Tax=Babylonia areolata TaxID=304850 RepID=UPI003FD2640B